MILSCFYCSENNFTSYCDDQELKQKRGENTFISNKEGRWHYVNMFEDGPTDGNLTIKFPAAYIKHINFLDFEEFDRLNPIYINMVRNPIDRVISWYYYIRQGWYQLNRQATTVPASKLSLKKNVMPPPRFKMTFEECFRQKDPECTYPVQEGRSGMGGSHVSQVN